MKTIVHILIACLLACTTTGKLCAQNSILTDSTLDRGQIEFPPLQLLIDSAIAHNAMASYRTLEVQVKKADMQTQKNAWMRNMGLQADSRYGTFNNLSTSSTDINTVVQTVSNKQLIYGAGVYIKLPLFDLINRKNQVKQARSEMEAAKFLEQAQQDEVRQAVIKLFHEVLLRQKLLGIKSQNYGNAAVNMEMVEKEFRNGVIPLAEYVRLSDMTARIQSEYEMARADFAVSKELLETLTGLHFKNPAIKEVK